MEFEDNLNTATAGFLRTDLTNGIGSNVTQNYLCSLTLLFEINPISYRLIRWNEINWGILILSKN